MILYNISQLFSFYHVYVNVEILGMLYKSIEKILSFEANDKTILKEIIHPKNDNVPLNYSLAQAVLKKGESSLPHCLLNQTELYIFLSGEGEIVVGEDKQKVKSGTVVLVPKGAKQHVENHGDSELKFLCIVSPPWKKGDDQLL